MSAKFISLVVAASMAVTSFTAAPARASDKELARALAAIAGIAIIGAAIHDNSKRKDSHVSTRGNHGYYGHQPRRAHKNVHRSHKKQRRQAAKQRAYQQGYNAHQREVKQRRAERRAARRAYHYGHQYQGGYSARPYNYGH